MGSRHQVIVAIEIDDCARKKFVKEIVKLGLERASFDTSRSSWKILQVKQIRGQNG